MKIVITVKMKMAILVLVRATDRRKLTSPITAMITIPVFRLQEKQQKLYFGTSGTYLIVKTMPACLTTRNLKIENCLLI
jgi:hypothetical protein